MPDKQAIVDLEKKFWDTMVSKDAATATDMMAKKSIVIGPQGVAEISRGDFAKMMETSKWTLDSYKMSDIQVVFPSEDTAVIGYKVSQKGTMEGKPYSMEAADATTWTREGKEWLCALHTETVIGNPPGGTG
ncbi:MAG TPA: nuclear transport factor 2 family protein [Mesorhizobium sp.]